ncbi:hypothetical protein MATL_G00032610 [Megalops atlanticus]|uniref:Uncharacterized protein n=1 Tax=Megalops atlanticus TaxID=7932 RepID=A0A9D3QEF7_MEGAT|nr:hypothetical protein MATL_G00032610 [Megalops atlanticus]
MKVTGSLRFATGVAFAVVIVSLAQGRNTSHTTPTAKHPAGEATEGDFIRFDHAPDAVIDRYNLSVQYLCSRPCLLGVEVVASVGRRSGVVIFRRRWTQREWLGMPTTHPLLLRFPDALAYRRDFFIRRSVDAYDVMLRAWLDHLGRHSEAGPRAGGYHQALTRVFKVLQSMPPTLRPLKQHGACPSWGAELTWQVTRDRARQCPLESDTVELLKFPLASTGEKFGVICRLNPFLNRELERARLRAATDPRVTLSVWIYLLNWCGSKLCGIFHHVDPDNTFSTPVITLTNTGDIVFQVRLASGGDRAFRCHTALALRTWHRLQFFMEGSKVTLQVKSLEEEDTKTHTYDFHNDVHYNDTAGYFVIGGDKFMPGIEGYFGPIKYHRLRAEEVISHLSPEKTLQQLDKTHRMCEETKEFITAFLQALKESEDITKTNACRSLLWDWRKRFGRQTCSALPWSRRVQRLYHPLLELLAEQNFISGIHDFRDSNATLRFGRRVFLLALQRLASRGSRGPEPVSSLIPLLQVSSCLGHPRASFLLAIIHLVGLGVPADTLQGHVYSLAGAQADDRLALMHLGYKHTGHRRLPPRLRPGLLLLCQRRQTDLC